MTAVEQPDLRAITDADVYIDDALSGRLTRQSHDSTTFDYLPAEPTADSSVRDRSVSWSLLRTDTYPQTATGGAVPPFFAGLLPEGVRLGVVTSSTKTSADDHLTLLLAVGADTIGNVRVVPAGTPPPARLPMFQPHRDTDFRDVYAKLTGSVDADPVGLAGVQPKVSALTWSTPTRTSTGPAILKLGPVQFPLLVENEHFFMRMAAACGLRVPRTSVLHDANGHSALMVTRFDRDRETRIAQEDACQVDGIYPASKYRIKTETAIEALANACARGGGSKATAVLELLKTVVFSWLIGNGDLHGKNLSIYKPNGIWQPTPAYDLLTTQPYVGWKDPMALNLFGRANNLDRAHFLYAAQQLGLRSRAPSRMIDSVVHAAGEWPDRCAEIGFDTRQTQLVAEMLRARIETLK
jgi:serine/threonine-protein kinase HipA